MRAYSSSSSSSSTLQRRSINRRAAAATHRNAGLCSQHVQFQHVRYKGNRRTCTPYPTTTPITLSVLSTCAYIPIWQFILIFINHNCSTIQYNKKLSCRREAARCFVFVCSQLQHTYSAVFLLLVPAASDLLVHKILLNSVLLSPIVSGGVQPKLPGQKPRGHNLPCFLPLWIGWGQDPASWVG